LAALGHAKLLDRALACCKSVADRKDATGSALALKVLGKLALAKFVADHRAALDDATAAASTSSSSSSGGGGSGPGQGDGSKPNAVLLRTLLEQDMHTLDDARSFMTADALALLGVPLATAQAFLAAR
jgi:hypothetical protein